MDLCAGSRFLFRDRKEELSVCRGCTLAFPVARCEIERRASCLGMAPG